jgi:acyl dehydratase
MAIAEDIIGTHYRYDDHFVVGREKVREFANAIKDDHPAHHDVQAALDAGHPGIVAPLTFIAVAGRRVQLEMFKQFDVGINLERVIHRDQKLKFHRPIVTGDYLYFETFLDSVIQSHGTVIAELRSEVTDAAGALVLTTVVTMIGEAISDEHTDAQVAAIASRIGGE